MSACSSSLPFSNLSACSAVSHRPSFVMPIGTTSYFVLSIAFRTDAADSNDTSCSPLRPPKRMPTRIFAMPFQSGARRVSRQSQLWFRRDAEFAEKSFCAPVVKVRSGAVRKRHLSQIVILSEAKDLCICLRHA